MLHNGDTQSHMKRGSGTDAHTMDKFDACSLSSVSSESDLSLAFERELDEPTDYDELPAFEIRAFSHSRTPSPIGNDLNLSGGMDILTLTPKQQQPQSPQQRSPSRQHNPEYVALHEINAQISPPSDNAEDPTIAASLSRSNSLETIFEGVLLNTPPREKLNSSTGGGGSRYTPKRSRVNLLELVAINRLQCDKENHEPMIRTSSPSKDNGELT